MRRYKVLLLVAVTVSFVWLSTGCNTSGCTDNRNSIPLAGFYSSGNGEAIAVDSVEIGGVGAPGDSLLWTDKSPVSKVYLPLRSRYDNASFYIRYTSAAAASLNLADTISFTYTSEPYFASEECGAMYRYRITRCSYTTCLIDSVAIVDSLITNVDVERIHIYLRTRQADESYE